MNREGEWSKSSYSHGNGGQCVEAARTRVGAALRDTQNRDLGQLDATPREWAALLGAVKAASL
nr:DUF397 domain-containing protein [Nocardiopsis lucentensis]